MKQKISALALRYQAALRHHLDKKRSDNGDRAQGLGRAALSGGITARHLAVMHQHALLEIDLSVLPSAARKRSLTRADFFLAQALLPLEAAQKEIQKALVHSQRHNDTLRRHTFDLVRGSRRLEREINRRKAGEALIRKGREHYQVLFQESQVMQKKLRLLTRQIISAQEEERKEISRELHDEVVQTLVGINVELSALGKSATVGVQTLKDKIAHTQRLVEHSVNAVHRFARELRPAVLDDLGLIPALHAFSKALADRKKFKILLTAFGGVESLPSDKRIVLFRVAQEALTNVARHAQATEVRINITRIPGAIRTEVIDNGKSFAVTKTLRARSNKRLGLVGMRERVEMVGGTLTIQSTPGQGTTVRAEIPFNLEDTTS